MSKAREITDADWDRLCDWLADGVDDMTDEEIGQELREAGIDMDAAMERIRKRLNLDPPTAR